MFNFFPTQQSELPSVPEQEKYVTQELSKFNSPKIPYALSYAYFYSATESGYKERGETRGSKEIEYRTTCTLAIAGLLQFDKRATEIDQAIAVQTFLYVLRGARTLPELVNTYYPISLETVDYAPTTRLEKDEVTRIAYSLFKGLHAYEAELRTKFG